MLKIVKIILLGDSGVGKTTLICRYVDRTFQDVMSTVGVGIATKIVDVNISDQDYKLQIDDTAGQEIYNKALPKSHYKRIDGILLVYDLSKESSLNSIKKWIRQIKDNSEKKTVVLIAGNKVDLVEGCENIKGREIAEELKIPIKEMSAKSGFGVDDAFNFLLNLIVSSDSYRSRNPSIKILEKKPVKKRRFC